MAAAAVLVRSWRVAFAVLVLLELLQVQRARSATFTIANNCGYTCAATGCAAELNGACPADLRVESSAAAEGGGAAVACKSACGAYGRPEDCCSGDHNTPQTCRPSASSQFFKAACPRAYSYAYDDATSTFTCAAGATDYAVTFCPAAPTSVKSTGQNPQAAGLPQSQMNDTMVYVGRGGINAPQQQTSSSASLSVAAVNFLVSLAVAAVAL
ncbi:hypothetical protein EJB05_23001, partial [Eragrostis curvula]